MRESVSIHIYPRASKANKNGQHPIYVRITIEGKRTEFSTKFYINPKNWNYESARAKGKTTEANTLNSYLDTTRLKIQQTCINLSLLGIEININSFLQSYKGIKPKSRTLIPIFQNHNQKLKELIGKEYAEGTYTRYSITLSHIEKFLAWKYQKDDIDIEKIDNAFINDFDFYLRTVHQCVALPFFKQ